jgi:hypothetical protein
MHVCKYVGVSATQHIKLCVCCLLSSLSDADCIHEEKSFDTPAPDANVDDVIESKPR